MATEVVQLTRRRFGETMRRDAWWIQPLVVFVVLTCFLVYATWAAFQNKFYSFGNYLSPFYSPLLFADSPHAWIHGTRPSWIPSFLPFSPVPPRCPAHLLLLSGRLLQGILGGPTQLRRRRAAQKLSRGALFPAGDSEHSPLFPLRRTGLSDHTGPRRVQGHVLLRPEHRT